MSTEAGQDVRARLQGVAKAYGSHRALEPLSLELAAGRTTVLIGPSGCGKSTTLRILMGLIRPDAGDVEIGGELLTAKNLRSLRQRMGYVIQEGGLFPHLTARENLALQPRHVGHNASWINSRVDELRELVQLDADLLQRYPAELSGGQRQRIGLMRALMLDPDLLLLDEPLGALDPLIRAELQTQLRDIFRSLGKAVLLVTHDMGEAAWFGDEILLMRSGSIVQQGSLSDLLDRPADPFVTAFINAQRSPLSAATT